MISSQLSNYDDDPSPTTETPSPVVQPNTHHQSNGLQQSSVSNMHLPIPNVPVEIKENILKVQYMCTTCICCKFCFCKTV